MPLRGGVLRNVVLDAQTVTFEFASFGRRVHRTAPRSSVTGQYQCTVGPKGITFMALAITDIGTNETIAKCKPT
ncbi:hypothetical protein [Hymenobacter elongatus]|uniref:Uncharacterized protein n=1 Tax=Hymenobacter elongatus TaxID=877208 RepID=A0A4Z0PPB8_9BACT|nr:hypothetical protein [Hymenobacter elongatus]TGE16559.1 hypothetical protein E5J99_09250 [Hymenobacter elongatus]